MKSASNENISAVNLEYSQARGIQGQAKEKFAEVIKEMRGGRSYRSFAKIVGVSHPTLKAWETLDGTPDQESLEMVASLRGESISEFKDFLNGSRRPTMLQKLVQQVRSIPDDDLAVLLRAIANRIES